jgi:hypothetical protein
MTDAPKPAEKPRCAFVYKTDGVCCRLAPPEAHGVNGVHPFTPSPVVAEAEKCGRCGRGPMAVEHMGAAAGCEHDHHAFVASAAKTQGRECSHHYEMRWDDREGWVCAGCGELFGLVPGWLADLTPNPACPPAAQAGERVTRFHRINYKAGPGPWWECRDSPCQIGHLAIAEHRTATLDAPEGSGMNEGRGKP